MSPISADATPMDGAKLLRAIRVFERESLAGIHYAPFNLNSKNYRHIPKETETWFDRLATLLQASAELTKQGEHVQAVTCFKILYGLIDAMEDGQEIVFAEELGSWMIPGDEKKFIGAYLKSLSVVATPEEFAAVAIPLIRRDSHSSFVNQVHRSAWRVASQAQRILLQNELERRKISTEPK